jgi:hypothetical protein
MARLRTTPRDSTVAAGGLLGRVASIRTFQALENGAFRTLWLGMLASYLAMQMSVIARGFLAFQISGSATALGLVTMARGLPQLFLSPFGGVAADRMDKRRMLILTQSAMSALAVLTATLIALDVIEIWHLVVIGLAEGVVWAFNMPSRQSIVAEIVHDDHLMNAIALKSECTVRTSAVRPPGAGRARRAITGGSRTDCRLCRSFTVANPFMIPFVRFSVVHGVSDSHRCTRCAHRVLGGNTEFPSKSGCRTGVLSPNSHQLCASSRVVKSRFNGFRDT